MSVERRRKAGRETEEDGEAGLHKGSSIRCHRSNVLIRRIVAQCD